MAVTLAVNCHKVNGASFKFVSAVKDTVSKFVSPVNDGGGKFVSAVNDTGVKFVSAVNDCSARDWDGKDYLRIIPRVVW
jgi:hypothetical protein